ncbi:hypothetical protein Tco_1409570 [Tanacetum coccineum]
MSTGNRIWKQRLVDIGTVTAQQAKDVDSVVGWAAHLRMVLVRRTVTGFASGLWCCGHIEMWVEEASKSEGRAVGHVTCTELVADWAFDLIKAEKLAFLLSKSKSRPGPKTPIPYVLERDPPKNDLSVFPAVAADAHLGAREPTQQTRKGCLSGHLRMIRAWWAYPSQPGVCWDSRRAAPYDVHDQSDPDVPVESSDFSLLHRSKGKRNHIPVGKLDIKRTRGSIHGGASGFQCTASKIRMSLPADHCRPILEGFDGCPLYKLGCWIRDPRSRLDQHPTERGQSLVAIGWETKRTLGLFLSSSCPRSRSNTKRGISILDHKPLTPSSLGLHALGKGSSDGRPLGVKAKNGSMNRSIRPRTIPIHLLIVKAVSTQCPITIHSIVGLKDKRAKRSAFATKKANGQREGSRLSRTLAKLDSHSEALRVSEAL